MEDNVHHTLLDMADVYNRLSHSETFYYIQSLKVIRDDIRSKIPTLENLGRSINSSLKTLYFIEKNIYTLENVLRCFETKVYEKRTLFNHTETLWLN